MTWYNCLNQEPVAIEKYEKATNMEVIKSGIWGSPKLPTSRSKHLMVSLYEGDNGEFSEKGQCFNIKDQQMLLRRKPHTTTKYRYNSLMTEASFCDF